MGRYYFGQIVEASVPDGEGKTKVRTVVIIDNDIDDVTTDEITVVSISSTRDYRKPYYHIQVHNNKEKDPLTGLDCPCWAKCNFAGLLPVKRIRSSRGHMPDDLLEKIVNMYDRLFAAGDKFKDWQWGL